MPSEDFNRDMTAQALIQDTRIKKPHVVILGAGASKAAFPKGDKNGKLLPLMRDLISTVGLADELETNGVAYQGRNFEAVYSELYKESNNSNIISSINNRIRDYFSSLELPPDPTIYDHLVLSLREKDIIATFNWDPFLYQACSRNHTKASLPHTVYLYGNVAIGYCLDHMQKGSAGSNCSVCSKPFTSSNLLFPIENKGYNLDPYIKAEWETLRIFMKRAYMLTIFGYSAPNTDIEAMEIMKGAWGNVRSRNLEQTEVIDIKPEDQLRVIWTDFIHTHHYNVTDSIYRSSIGLFPRRTCEAEWDSAMEVCFLEQFPIPIDYGFDELWSWYAPLITAEINMSKQVT